MITDRTQSDSKTEEKDTGPLQLPIDASQIYYASGQCSFFAYSAKYSAKKIGEAIETIADAVYQSGEAIISSTLKGRDQFARLKGILNEQLHGTLDDECKDLLRTNITINTMQWKDIKKAYNTIKASKWIYHRSPETDALIRKINYMELKPEEKENPGRINEERAKKIFDYIFSNHGRTTDFRNAVLNYIHENILNPKTDSNNNNTGGATVPTMGR